METGPQRPSFVGVTRFSVAMVGNPSWRMTRKLTAGDEDRYLSALWSPERMAPRYELFSRLCAPQLQAMAGHHDYHHVVLYSPGLPEPWLGLLRATVQEHPVLQLVAVEGPGLPSVSSLVHKLIRGRRVDSGPVVAFRVDDDDLLALNFLEKLTPYANYGDRGRAVNLSRGFTCVWDESTLTVYDIRPVFERFSGRGQAFIGWYDTESGVLEGLPVRHEPHDKVDRFRPVIHDARHPSFLWTHHLHQDSHEGYSKLTPAERISRAMAGIPPGSPDELAQALRLFPTLHGRVEARDPVPAPAVPAPALSTRVRRWMRTQRRRLARWT